MVAIKEIILIESYLHTLRHGVVVISLYLYLCKTQVVLYIKISASIL